MSNALLSIAWCFGALFAISSTVFWAFLVTSLANRTSDGKMRLSNDDKDLLVAVVIALAAMWGLVAYCYPFGGAA